jgi:hypothetical protein
MTTNKIDSRLTEPAVVRFGFKSCTITTAEGVTVPAMIGRTSLDDNGNIEFFEAVEVYPGEYQGEEVLVDFAMLKNPYHLFHHRKDGAFRTERKYGPIQTAALTEEHIPVITYNLPAIPEELYPRLSPETAAEMRKLQTQQVEDFLTSGKKKYEDYIANAGEKQEG